MTTDIKLRHDAIHQVLSAALDIQAHVAFAPEEKPVSSVTRDMLWLSLGRLVEVFPELDPKE